MEIEFLVQNSGHDPSHDRILYLLVIYSNENILSFWYWNQAIQKPKIIYTSRTTTLMKETKLELEPKLEQKIATAIEPFF